MYIWVKLNDFTMTDRHENLLSAYFAGQITDTERAEIISLLESDSEFAASFREMEQAYIQACIPTFEKTKDRNFESIRKRIQTGRRPESFWRSFAVSACVAAVLILGAALYTGYRYFEEESSFSELDVMTITAKNGTGTEASLPDGTRVCLNAASLLTFDRSFGRDTRDVTLHGEGYFEVVSDNTVPFRVHTDNACVTVKGTVFNVRSYADEPETTVSLLHGSIVLDTESGETDLKPGTCAIVSRENGNVRVEEADPFASAWTNGKFVFTDKSIPEILQRVERNYGVRFIYSDDLFGSERFTGNLSLNMSIDEILSYLDVDRKYKWRRNDNKIEITRK